MILTESGFRFQRTGDRWRCVEHPAITMLTNGRFQVDGHDAEFDTIQEAFNAMMKGPPESSPDAGAP